MIGLNDMLWCDTHAASILETITECALLDG